MTPGSLPTLTTCWTISGSFKGTRRPGSLPFAGTTDTLALMPVAPSTQWEVTLPPIRLTDGKSGAEMGVFSQSRLCVTP